MVSRVRGMRTIRVKSGHKSFYPLDLFEFGMSIFSIIHVLSKYEFCKKHKFDNIQKVSVNSMKSFEIN